MPLTVLNSYSNGDQNILNVQNVLTQAFKGYNALTLTNMGNTTVPAIAAGSAIEINGSLLQANSEQAISTTDPYTSATVADGIVYIMIDGSTGNPYFTATPPTWSDSKQGWYGLTTWANWRYIPVKMTKSGTSYSSKLILFVDQIIGAGIASNSGTYQLDNNAIFNGTVTFNGAASFGASSIAGFLSDGTPYYKKRLTENIVNGFAYQSVAHGIANAYTSNKIINVYPYGQNGSAFWTAYFDNSGVSANALKYIYWDNTNIYAYRWGTSGAFTFYLTIEYI
jgi:hypothetical protein